MAAGADEHLDDLLREGPPQAQRPPATRPLLWRTGKIFGMQGELCQNELVDMDLRERGVEYVLGWGCAAKGTEVKKVAAVGSPEEMLEELAALPPAERCAYWPTRPDRDCKLLFDLDYSHAVKDGACPHLQLWRRCTGDDAADHPQPERLFEDFWRRLGAFCRRRGLPLVPERVAVSEAHRPGEKISFHVCCLDLCVPGEYRKDFYRSLASDEDLGALGNIVDLGIGSRWRHMRTIWSTKVGAARHLRPTPSVGGLRFFWASEGPPRERLLSTWTAHMWTHLEGTPTPVPRPEGAPPPRGARARGGAARSAPPRRAAARAPEGEGEEFDVRTTTEEAKTLFSLFALGDLGFDADAVWGASIRREDAVAAFYAKQVQGGACRAQRPSGCAEHEAHANNFVCWVSRQPATGELRLEGRHLKEQLQHCKVAPRAADAAALEARALAALEPPGEGEDAAAAVPQRVQAVVREVLRLAEPGAKVRAVRRLGGGVVAHADRRGPRAPFAVLLFRGGGVSLTWSHAPWLPAEAQQRAAEPELFHLPDERAAAEELVGGASAAAADGAEGAEDVPPHPFTEHNAHLPEEAVRLLEEGWQGWECAQNMDACLKHLMEGDIIHSSVKKRMKPWIDLLQKSRPLSEKEWAAARKMCFDARLHILEGVPLTVKLGQAAGGGPRSDPVIRSSAPGSDSAEEEYRRIAALAHARLVRKGPAPTDEAVALFADVLRDPGRLADSSRFAAVSLLPRFRCALGDDGGNSVVMYEFDGARWGRVPDGGRHFNHELRTRLQELADAAVAICRDEGITGSVQERAKELAACVQSRRWMQDVEDWAEGHLRTDDFYQKYRARGLKQFTRDLDSCPHLLGFDDGVFDTQHFRFYRAWSPELQSRKPVSKSCGYPFPGDDEGRPRDAAAAALLDRLEQQLIRKPLFRKEQFDCGRLVMGSLLTGGNENKKLVIMLGEKGHNGKTELLKWLELALGDYYGTLPTATVVERRTEADQKNPSLVQSRKKRLCVMNEGSKEEVLNNSTVKLLTGNDSIVFRDLYKSPFSDSFLPKLLYVSNSAPRYDDNDNAARNRMYPLSFDAHFRADVTEEDWENGVFRAVQFDEREKAQWGPCVMLLLVRYAKELRERGGELPPPPSSQATAMVAEAGQSAGLQEWMGSRFIKTTPDDWARHGELTVTKTEDLLMSYNRENDREKMVRGDFIAALKRFGYRVDKQARAPKGTAGAQPGQRRAFANVTFVRGRTPEDDMAAAEAGAEDGDGSG